MNNNVATNNNTSDEQAPTATLKIVNPAGLYDPIPNGYSHAVVSQGGSRVAYIAGQGGEDKAGNLPVEFAEQVMQAFANLHIALDAVGAKPNQVSKITTYIVDHDEAKLDVLAQRVKEMFNNTLPAQTLVPVPRLALDGMLFEVDAIACLD